MFRRASLTAVALVLLTANSVLGATVTVKMYNNYFSPKTQTVALGNSVKWRNVSTKRHDATPMLNWSLGGSLSVAAGATSTAKAPTQAGTFGYFCSLHANMTGTIKVPMTVSPIAGTTATYFSFTLGTVVAPGVLVHQLESRPAGGAWSIRVTTNQPSTSIFFPNPGTYELRTRMRNQLSGQVSAYSPTTTITVY